MSVFASHLHAACRATTRQVACHITLHANAERADAYVGRIVDYCTGFSMFPERGRRRDDILPGLRLTGFERRVTIAYLVTADAVLIEGVFYGGQDFETALRSDFKG